ncbi:MAG: magnesium/cobalt transporter CorA [Planctomycetota bacterium]
MLESRIYRKNGNIIENLTREEIGESLRTGKDVLWVDFYDPTDAELSILVDVFKFHSLAIEDCLLPRHHPKVDDYGEYLFMVIHAPDLTTCATEISTHELDIFLGKNYVVTFHDKPVRSVTNAALKAKETPAKIMGRGADFLAYEILDGIFNNYDALLDRLDSAIDVCQRDIVEEKEGIMEYIRQIQHTAYSLFRTVRMQREFLRNLSRGIYRLISKKCTPYFRDIYDHLVRINETLEMSIDSIKGAREAYLYHSANRTNEIIKVLTVLTAVLMIPTLITGIYGMNLKLFPNEEHPFGFWSIIIVLVLSVVPALLWFRKKGWF